VFKDVNIFPHINSARMDHSDKHHSPTRGAGYKTDIFFFSHLKDQLKDVDQSKIQ